MKFFDENSFTKLCQCNKKGIMFGIARERRKGEKLKTIKINKNKSKEKCFLYKL